MELIIGPDRDLPAKRGVHQRKAGTLGEGGAHLVIWAPMGRGMGGPWDQTHGVKKRGVEDGIMGRSIGIWTGH
ncbi:hypothetical protein FHL15_001838 [Xylaria flabelliformis]|uniref:Uncharacterized protein n=1 Tax=Xylaria flabelliformis TaxID=2512241 RepID=A0A553IA27_9PEZI|nr:hypothetical protein FHL15_001838 [Xylaria flabelliformis]